MPDGSKKFHEFALKSALFKGRSDWYFCYLKTEKIAHVLNLLVDNSEGAGELAHRAGELPSTIAHLAAGEMGLTATLADVFGMLSAVRTASSQGILHKDSGSLLCREYESVAERLVMGSNPSPFLPEDFRIGVLPEYEAIGQSMPPLSLKDIKDTKDTREGLKGQSNKMSDRMSLILGFIRKNKQVSIKEIAAVIRGCSEKTIQRELGSLIEQGLVRKMGERRWSVYLAA